ncbi:MAG: molybdopterin cofactor-binding domain-containing protein [Pseudomonadales bacterium]
MTDSKQVKIVENTLSSASRREFLRRSGIVGGGLFVGVSLSSCSDVGPAIEASKGRFTPNAFLQISSDGEIFFHNPRDEMGQGVYMGLTTLIAEELYTHFLFILFVIVDAHPDYAAPSSGFQATGGSGSVRDHYLPLRQAAANARELLLLAASNTLGVDAKSLRIEDANVVHGDTKHSIGQFADAAEALPPQEAATLKSADQFQFIGKEIPRIDAVAKSTGTAPYGIDADLENLHRAVVRHSPVPGGKVKSFDGSKAKAIPGVVDVIEIHSGVAVVADHYWPAKKAAALIDIEWESPKELLGVSSASIRADYEAAMRSDEGEVYVETNDAPASNAAEHTIEADYWSPYLSHSPMEPMNGTVHIQGDTAEAWAGNQGPISVQGMVTRYAGIDADKVTVHGLFSGGGFGRRAYVTHVGEAAALARITGLPIQVIWSRETDTQNGWFRPASLVNINASVDADGIINDWQAKRVGANITPEMVAQILPVVMPSAPQGVVDFMSGAAKSAHDGWIVDHSSLEGLYDDYDWPNKKITHKSFNHGIPTLFWRSVGHSYTAFAKECAVDELAVQASIDPVDLRLRNCKNNPRLANVIRRAGEVYAQGASEDSRFLGFAAHTSFQSHVAQVAEVSVENNAIKVHKVTCVVDCGVAVNPQIVRDQMSGAIMFGLTAALYGEIDIVDGAVKQSNFHDYPILRMTEAPTVDVIIIDSVEAPTGVGEPGLPPIGPAVANAVFRATGQRLRDMPLRLA